jgi:hypothetical protein
MRSLLGLAFGALAIHAACAQTQVIPTTTVLTWTAPVANTDRTPITGSLSYNIYQGASATSLSKVGSTSAGVSSFVVSSGLTPGTTQYFAVSAVANAIESALTPAVSLAIPFPTPAPPTALSCTLQTVSSTSTTATITITCKALP